jgi:hypothetical protein
LTDSGGNIYHFQSSHYGIPDGTLFAGFATIGDIVIRGLAVSSYHSVSLPIDPISEAAAEILDARGYSSKQSVALLDLVRQANASTNFGGLSLEEAIARARAVATADPNVQAALPTWTPTETPTPRPTSTPTPTRTLRPTGTPRACVGDCTGDGQVEVDELITGVNLVLGQLPVAACTAGYRSSQPEVSDLLAAVYNALYGCHLPDLVPVGVEFATGPSCKGYYLSYCLSVCVANVGDGSASPFMVSIDDGSASVAWRVNGLAAGDGECDLACNTAFEGSVRVDAEDEVPEAREDNNVTQFRISTPTPPPPCPSPTPT